MKKTNTLILSLLTAAAFTTAVQAQTLVPKWSKTSGITLGSGNNGLGYSPVTHNVIASVCASGTAGNATIYRIRASDGTVLTPNLTVNSTISGGTYVIGGLAVGTDGAIYACTYGAASSIKLYKWADESSAPTVLGTFTVGVGSIGKNLTVYGTGNNAVFLLTSTTTGPIYVYYDTGTSTWKAKALTVSSGSCQTSMSFVSWSPTSCTFVSKNSAASGNRNVFNPGASSPITVTQTGISGTGWASGSGTIQNVAYEPASTLLGTFTRNVASPWTITVNTWATGIPSGSLTAPAAQTAQTGDATAADGGAAGACCWGDGMYFCMPAVTGFGLRAYDVTAFKVADTSPASTSKNPGESASFSVVSGGSQLTYQWKKDGTAIPDATTASLTLPPVSLADAGSYTCTVSGVSGSTWTSSAGVLHVPQSTTTTLSSSTATSTYGEAVTFTATVSAASGTPTGTVAFKDGATTLGTTTLTAAGTAEFTTSTLSAVASPHSITAAYSGTPDYSASTSDASTQTVTPKTLVPSVTVGNKAYDGTLAAVITGRSLDGVVGTDNVTLDGSGATAFPDVTVGSYTLTVTGLALSGTTAGNYILSTDTVTATAEITPKALTITSLTVEDKAYDRTTTATLTGSAVLAGVVGSEDVSLTGTAATAFPSATAGTYTVTITGFSLTGGAVANYILAPLTQTAKITPKVLTAEGIYASDKVYDGTLTNITLVADSATLLGVIEPDVVSLDPAAAIGYTTNKAIGSQFLQITNFQLTGPEAANYQVEEPYTTNVNVTARTLNVTATAASKTYDASDAATVTLSSDKVSGDDVAVAYTAAAFSDQNAGTAKTVTVSEVSISGADASNYALSASPVTATANITPIALSITGVTANSKVYDGTDLATLAGSAALSAGVLGTEVVTLAGTPMATFDTKNIGTAKPVTVLGYTLEGTDAGNYTLSQPAGLTANVTPVALSVVGVTANTKTYDGTATATLSGAAALSAGVVSGEDVNLGGTASALFDNATVGTAKPVTVTGYTLTGAAIGNYTLAQPTGLTADITPATSTLALLSSLNPSTNGDSVTFTATVSSSAGTPTGNVVFLTNGVAMATVALSSGTATASTADLPVGTTPVLAQYAAQDNWQTSSDSLAQEVRSAVTLSTTNAVLSIVANGGGVFTLNCLGTPGAQYYVVAGADLTAAVSSWTALAGSTNTAPSPSGLWSCQVSNAAPAFYRTVAINPAP